MSESSIEYYNAAIDAVQAGQMEEALAAVENSLTEDPKDGQTWQLYVVILNALGRAADAEKARAKVAEIARYGDAILPGAPTYFIPNEQITEYNERIVEVFGA